MNVTVILCTYNRCEVLAEALISIASSVLAETVEWEVLVVDNNSKDQTRAVVEEFSRRHSGRFRYLFESKQGLSNARNAGICAAAGEIVAFTDDDVTVHPLWLQNLTAPLLDGPWAGSAGRIRLGQSFQPPSWLALSGPFSLGPALVQFDLGDQEGPLGKAPFGANMAFRKAIFEKYGGFRADLGRCGKNLIGNEETEFCKRLMAAGERLWYAPSAEVYHPVLKERVKKSYFRSYHFGQGRSEVRQAGQGLPIWKIPRYCLREIRGRWRWMSSTHPQWFLSTQDRFFCELAVFHAFGKGVESFRCFYLAGRKPESRTPPQIQSKVESIASKST